MNDLYLEDLNNTISSTVDIEKIKNSTIFITGSNGLIGSYIIDTIMLLNKNNHLFSSIV